MDTEFDKNIYIMQFEYKQLVVYKNIKPVLNL